MNILVTGGAGYIGSHVVRKLLKKGYDVIIYDNLIHGHEYAIPENAKFIKGDLADTDLLEKIFNENKIDAVMHFAAYASVGESVVNPKKYFQNNIINGINLLNKCQEHGIRKFIFSSSCAIFGTPTKLPITESETKKPENPYGETKLIFESILKRYDHAYGLKHINLRYFNASGADESGEIGEDHDPETHLIPLIFDVAIGKKSEIKIFGSDYNTPDGTCIRDYVHVNDLANVHVLALESLKNESMSFNIGVGKGYSVNEIIKICEEITGKEIKKINTGRRDGDPPELFADSSKLQNELKWKPEYDIKDIISSAWIWHQKLNE